ncbi:UNVERIFIED_CONTAM: Presequence protease 2, chloroplastic/mitochondrial [Sesamum radiatum]|uniref:Presequence protease 2, chloroplastic/mitochondrial n=1 Tax=Sesamum radiatum TaxID=300843 RepID=A0AAW2RXT7_SESRA
MERAVLLRSLSSSSSTSTLASSTRLFSRSVHRLARLPRRHRLVPNVHQRSLLRRHLGFISSVSRPSLQLSRHFCSLSVRAVATSSVQSSPEVLGADDDVAEKLGFEKVSDEFIEECKSRAVLYKHKKTGAEVMSVSNEDENKVFGIVFRTPPKDSTGIPHILEHSVLCGSRKYPLKEPFVELLKGSLHTFLNAFTYPDRTCYPVASTNTKDFYNLVDVYLDAVFFPKCVEDIKTFQQEGWHYELNDPSEDITYKGVVFNEMKGVYSQPDSILGRASQQALCPDNTYGVDSGGDPQVIPKLTFEEFKEFHQYLDMFEANSAAEESRVGSQKLFSEPVRIVEKYPAAEGDDLKKKHMVCLNWLLSETPLDLETELALGFLDH